MAIPVFPGEVPGSGVIYKRGMIPALPIREGLAAWFRYGIGITTVTGAVSQWDDASGNGRHLKQGTGANRPTLKADNTILFSGTATHFLKCDAFTLVQPETVYFLGKQITWTANDSLWDGNAVNTMRLFQTGTTPSLSLQAGATVAANTEFTLDTYMAICAVYNGASSLIQVMGNTPTTGSAGAGNAGGFHLGVAGDSGSGPSNIEVKEVLIFAAAHNPVQRAAVLKYLARVGKLTL
jgi:hypothetical protein